jgi:hypothetical protein
MSRRLAVWACFTALVIAVCATSFSVGRVQAAESTGGAPSLTIYNQKFAVVRQTIPLKLNSGVTHVSFSDITAHAEPDSVVLRDLHGGGLRILEQNYRNDPISDGLLLSLFEGKTIDFIRIDAQGHQETVQGKVIRSGYVPHYAAFDQYGYQYQMAQNATASGGSGQPIIEVDGKLQFSLPGTPRFPSLGDDTILKPTLDWELESQVGGEHTAELSYVSGGMSWKADYNIVAPETSDSMDIVGWVTLDNQSGKGFENARIKLMAGDVSKIQPQNQPYVFRAMAGAVSTSEQAVVTQKAFDEYHLYTLARATTLRDRETKQVEFLRASNVHAARLYVYDGFQFDEQYRGWNPESIRENANYGIKSNPKVWVMLEFRNSKDNSLGMPLPAGRVRFYRHDSDGQMEFTGEDKIDHTPSDETVRFYTGNAFDVVGERVRTFFRVDSSQRWTDESFEISLRNHKATPVNVNVVEHLYRWSNWKIEQKSDDFKQKDSQTIEFPVAVAANGEKKVSYSVHYSW